MTNTLNNYILVEPIQEGCNPFLIRKDRIIDIYKIKEATVIEHIGEYDIVHITPIKESEDLLNLIIEGGY